jgi:hypothetical protein
MSAEDKVKLDGIEAGANKYAHPTGDGSLHVPATGAGNSGKVLTAGATAGSASWQTPLALGAGATNAALGNHSHNDATQAAAGFMSAADKKKLDELGERVTSIETESGRVVLSTPGVKVFNVPKIVRDGKKKLWVRGVGGGGSGVASNGTGFCSGGSGAGGFDVLLDLKGISEITCTVGEGAPGVSAGNVGKNGGATSFGPYATAMGGLGGRVDGNLPAGGVATIGNAAVGIVMHGAYPGGSVAVPAGGSVGGTGGSSLLGIGGIGTTSGGQTSGFGAGSGGVTGPGIPSQPGGHGVLILEW